MSYHYIIKYISLYQLPYYFIIIETMLICYLFEVNNDNNTIFIKHIINKSFSMRCTSMNDEKYNHIKGINKEKYTNLKTP